MRQRDFLLKLGIRAASTALQVRAFVIAAILLSASGEPGYALWSLSWNALQRPDLSIPAGGHTTIRVGLRFLPSG